MEIYVIVIMLLCIGSFLNVCIYRIPVGSSVVYGRSACPACGHTLGPVDLIPVLGFVLRMGKCHYCGAKISARYPLVELGYTLLGLLAYWRFGLSPEFFLTAALFAVLVVVTGIDLDTYLIPDRLNVAILVLAAVRLLFHGVPGLFSALLGGFVLFALSYGIAVASRGNFGGGDIKLFAALGLWFGWRLGLELFFIAFMIGGVVAVAALLVLKKGRRDPVPFGPSIAAAAVLVQLFGEDIIRWYFGLL